MNKTKKELATIELEKIKSQKEIATIELEKIKIQKEIATIELAKKDLEVELEKAKNDLKVSLTELEKVFDSKDINNNYKIYLSARSEKKDHVTFSELDLVDNPNYLYDDIFSYFNYTWDYYKRNSFFNSLCCWSKLVNDNGNDHDNNTWRKIKIL
jgi:hypothetical protein